VPPDSHLYVAHPLPSVDPNFAVPNPTVFLLVTNIHKTRRSNTIVPAQPDLRRPSQSVAGVRRMKGLATGKLCGQSVTT